MVNLKHRTKPFRLVITSAAITLIRESYSGTAISVDTAATWLLGNALRVRNLRLEDFELETI